MKGPPEGQGRGRVAVRLLGCKPQPGVQLRAAGRPAWGDCRIVLVPAREGVVRLSGRGCQVSSMSSSVCAAGGDAGPMWSLSITLCVNGALICCSVSGLVQLRMQETHQRGEIRIDVSRLLTQISAWAAGWPSGAAPPPSGRPESRSRPSRSAALSNRWSAAPRGRPGRRP